MISWLVFSILCRNLSTDLQPTKRMNSKRPNKMWWCFRVARKYLSSLYFYQNGIQKSYITARPIACIKQILTADQLQIYTFRMRNIANFKCYGHFNIEELESIKERENENSIELCSPFTVLVKWNSKRSRTFHLMVNGIFNV